MKLSMRSKTWGRWTTFAALGLGVALIGVLAVSAGSAQQRPPEEDKKSVYEREIPGTMQAEKAMAVLEKLQGTWEADWPTRQVLEGQSRVPVVFQPGSCGTVLLERMNPNPAEGEADLFNVYHLDGPDLVVTHYCAMGNQPKMRLDRDVSTPRNLVFRFEGASNLGRSQGEHMRLERIAILDSGEAVQEWSIWDGSKRISSHRMVLRRAEERPAGAP